MKLQIAIALSSYKKTQVAIHRQPEFSVVLKKIKVKNQERTKD